MNYKYLIAIVFLLSGGLVKSQNPIFREDVQRALLEDFVLIQKNIERYYPTNWKE